MAIKKTTTFSESNINTNNNTSSLSIKIYFSANNNLTWFESATLSCTCNGVTKTKTVSHPIGGSVSTTFTFTNIAHNNDGTKSVNWSWRCPTGTSTLGTMTDSGTKSLTKINRQATMTNASNFNDEQNPQVWFNNPGNFLLRMKIEAGGNTELIVRSESTVKNTNSPYTWELTETERNTLRNLSKNFATLPVRFTIGTSINGSIANWSYLDRTMTMVNANPIFSDFEYEDINTSTIAITDDNSKVVLGYSTLRVSIDTTNKAEAQKYADMKYYLINNVQYPYEENFSVDVPNWNSETITVTAVDSRGLSTSVSKKLTVASYTPLQKGGATIARDGNISEETKLTYNGVITKTLPNGNSNTITATYQYKKTTEQNYTTGTTNITPTIDSEGNFGFDNYVVGDIVGTGFDIDESYDIKVIVSDVLSEIQYTYTLNSGIPAIAVKGNKIALHGAYDENDDADVQLNGKVNVDGNLYINGEVISTGDIDSYQLGASGYVRFKNGFQIAWIAKFNQTAGGTAWGSVYYSDHSMGNWPISFSSLYNAWPSVTSTSYWVTSSGWNGTSGGTVRCFRPNSHTGSVAVTITGIGKWK